MEDDTERLAYLTKQLEPDELAELDRQLTERPALERVLTKLVDAMDRDEQQHTVPEPVSSRPSSIESLGPTRLSLHETIGRGGMAVVHLGRQLHLERDVAVKTLRPDVVSADRVERLLAEARLTGRLEHPNIVPVHDIVMRPDGVPQVVLKRIEGRPWAELFDDGKKVEELFGESDLVDWNLSVLLAVCRALSFAHSKRIVHRDVKPENVMVGRFGEVYLLDWGIAVELPESHDPTEPSASVVREVAGTIGYMAPEQLDPEHYTLGPWTDTYQLGATLFHVLTGRAPFAGRKLAQRREEKPTERVAPVLPGGIAPELVNLVRRAMAVDPEDRIQSPAEFRQALEELLRHRGARRLIERAEQDADSADEARDAGDAAEAERAAVAADLGFRAALEAWPESERAAVGAERLAIARIEHALAKRQPKVAARLIATMTSPPPQLARRVQLAVAEAEAETRRLRAIASDTDRLVGMHFRRFLVAAFGTLWVGWWIAVAISPPEDEMPLIWFSTAFFVLGFPVIWMRRGEMLGNRLNRAMLLIVSTMLIAMIVWLWGGAALGFSVVELEIVMMLLWAMAASAASAMIDLRSSPIALAWLIAFATSSADPSLTPYALVGGSLATVINMMGLNLWLAREARAGKAPIRFSSPDE